MKLLDLLFLPSFHKFMKWIGSACMGLTMGWKMDFVEGKSEPKHDSVELLALHVMPKDVTVASGFHSNV